MRRGFKTEAERLAAQVRTDMGLGPYKPMNIKALVRHVGAQLRTADELTSLTKLEELEALQPGAFSACTFDLGTRKVVVVSPLSTDERRNSDASHEASHLLLDHKVREVEQLGGLSFFTCDPDEEQEANWLAGCLLLPRDLLVRSLKNGLDAAAIAEANTVSIQMANFRLRATGAERQVAAFRR
jgi:Zn-dependent peptidase ImmA (M78 family)